MDPSLGFAQLLGLAQDNQADKTISSKQLARKREQKREKGKIAPNVKKFLEKKEVEERRKRIEKKLELEKLNEARSAADKNKINKHLKVTKSSNKSVLDDAINSRDTADTLLGRKQCDEDDYGFASKTSQGLYEKLMSKYEADPEDPMAKFSRAQPKEKKDLSSAKERVKEALKREQEERYGPRKRRSRVDGDRIRNISGEDGGGGGSEKSSSNGGLSKIESEKEKKKEEERKSKSERERKEEEARRKRKQMAKNAPPPIDFQSLLKMANEKKDIPVNLEKIKKKSGKEGEMRDRPMTEQEKKEFMREQESRLRREGKLPPKEKPIERRSNGPELDLRDSRGKEKKETGPMFHQAAKKMMPQVPDFEKEKKEMERKMKEQMEKMKELEKKEMEFKMQKQKEEERKLVDEKRKLAMYNEKKKQDYEKRREEERRKEMERMRMKKSEGNKKEMEDMKAKYKEMERKMEEMKRRLNGGAGSSSSSGKRDVREVEARRFPGEKGYREERGGGSASWKNRIESESEEEYDSELDDFIDDSDAKIDVSKEIRSIFGYDKRKYRDEDFDDRSMENNKFSSIMMEEARSARIGRQEDLEDIRREEEENKRKMMKKFRR